MQLKNAKRIVIKCGSALLVDGAKGIVRFDWLSSLAKDIAKLRSEDKEVIIVTSGAVALGRKALKLKAGKLKKKKSISQVQIAGAGGDAVG